MLNFVQRFQKMDENLEHNNQVNNPLHGIKLADILEYLVLHLGWEKMASLVNIRCFKDDPSIKSSLKFLRTTPWAREKVETMYLLALKRKS
jgi:uncharacterized protein (DUF2132 family)